MAGEQMQEAGISDLGIEGDRRLAVMDAKSGVSLSAKRYPQLLHCNARVEHGGVLVTLQDGSEYAFNDPLLAESLSELFHREVVIKPLQQGEKVRHEFPGSGNKTYIHEPGIEAFFDGSPLHLITTATMRKLSQLQPESSFDVPRFRPNIVVASEDGDFMENQWVGKKLIIGACTLQATAKKPRCVMTTLPQKDLDRDKMVLVTIGRHNSGNAGIDLKPMETGIIRVNDEVKVVD